MHAHPRIAYSYSQGRLTADECVERHLLCDLPDVTRTPDTTQPFVFVDTAGEVRRKTRSPAHATHPLARTRTLAHRQGLGEDAHEEGQSRSNAGEAELVLRWVQGSGGGHRPLC